MSGLVVRELTARGRGGVAVLEVRGPEALARVRRLCEGARLEPGRLVVARLVAPGAWLDEALVAVLAEDAVELHLHGSPALVRAVRERLGPSSDPAAARGLEQRAALLAAAAPSEAGARILLDQAEGALRRELQELRSASPAEQERRLDALLARAPAVLRALQPALVVLLGPANAGKSTLFNALVGAERVLVSAELGTTRDVVVERARLGAYPVDLADGPGERDGQPERCDPGLRLERQAGRLVRTVLARADLVLWLSPAPRPAPPPAWLESSLQVAVVRSQVDLQPAGGSLPQGPALSARADPAAAAACVAQLFRQRLELPADPWVPGAPALFEAAQVERARRARAAPPSRRVGLLSGLLDPPGPGAGVDVDPDGARR